MCFLRGINDRVKPNPDQGLVNILRVKMVIKLGIKNARGNGYLKQEFLEITDLVNNRDENMFRTRIDAGAAVDAQVIVIDYLIMTQPDGLGRAGPDAFHPAAAFIINNDM
jgi:hypothetical protein